MCGAAAHVDPRAGLTAALTQPVGRVRWPAGSRSSLPWRSCSERPERARGGAGRDGRHRHPYATERRLRRARRHVGHVRARPSRARRRRLVRRHAGREAGARHPRHAGSPSASRGSATGSTSSSQLGGRTGDRRPVLGASTAGRSSAIAAVDPVDPRLPAPARGSSCPDPHNRLYLAVGAELEASPGGHASRGRSCPSAATAATCASRPRGVRGPFGLAFIPGTASLLLGDNGRDDLGANRPPDELNLDPRCHEGRAPDFGFPGCADRGATTSCAHDEPSRSSASPPHSRPAVSPWRKNWRGGEADRFVASTAPLPGRERGPLDRPIRSAPPPRRRLDTRKADAGLRLRRPGPARPSRSAPTARST